MRSSIAALLLMPVLAAAQPDFSYTYVEGSVLSSERDEAGPFDGDGDGIGIEGSFAVTRRIHVVGSYEDIGFDFDLDQTTLQIGAGYHYSLEVGFDLVGRVSYIEADLDVPGPDFDADGFGLEGGLRARFARRAEFDAGISYTDVRSSNTSLFFEGRYFLQPNLAVGGGVASNDGDLTLSVDIRFDLDAA